jgi:ABC-type Zn uptake system ZnuABC Zn-binding protein ZnuA
MKAEHVKVIIREPFQDPDAAEFVARATGATILELQTHPDGTTNAQGIIDHFEHNLEAIAAALDATEDKSQ